MTFYPHACTFHSSIESCWDCVLYRVRLPASSVNHGVWIPAQPCFSSQGHTQPSRLWCFSVTRVLLHLEKFKMQWHLPSQVGTVISTHFTDGFTQAWQENCRDESLQCGRRWVSQATSHLRHIYNLCTEHQTFTELQFYCAPTCHLRTISVQPIR